MSGSERQVVYKLGNKLCVYSTYVVKAHDNKESVHVAWTQHIVMESSMTGAFLF